LLQSPFQRRPDSLRQRNAWPVRWPEGKEETVAMAMTMTGEVQLQATR